MQAPGGLQKVPYFDVAGARIWGTTAMALAEFAALLGGLPTSVSR